MNRRVRFEQAIEAFETAVRLSGNWPINIGALGHCYAVSGRRSEARQVLENLIEMSKRRYVQPYELASIHAALGEKDRAFEYLKRAYADRSQWLSYLNVDPRQDSLRSDPRFSDLIRRMNLQP
jgi:tetratricopeptide (TPR) repeat protein